MMILQVVLALFAILFYLYHKLSKNKNHWKDRGVVNTGFHFFWGNDKDMLTGKRSLYDVAKEEYFKFTGERYYGGWTVFGQPYLMIRNDFDLIRSIWIKDFDHFNKTRGEEFFENVWPGSREEKLAINNVANIHGEEWKDVRSTFTPIFSSGKLKQMLPLLQQINVNMERYIKEESKITDSIELKDLMGKFSMDALASCAFGVDSGSFTNRNQDSEFVKHAKIIFNFGSPSTIIKTLIATSTPPIVKKFVHSLGFKTFATVANLPSFKFFFDIADATIKHRKESKTRRNDLIDLMIDATEGTIESTENDNTSNNRHRKKHGDLDYDRAISTSGIMLVVGYDTTATTMSWILYELALNQDCQDTLFEEIENAQRSGALSYDTIQSLPYLDAVIHETLRRHPVMAAMERPCTKEYKVPNSDLTIKKGELVRVNATGICFDPEIYPNPDVWNPENFSKENRANRSPYSFMGFSLGPRNCLAMRFAMFEMKAAISGLVSTFKVLPTNKTILNPQIGPSNLTGASKDGLYVKFENRS